MLYSAFGIKYVRNHISTSTMHRCGNKRRLLSDRAGVCFFHYDIRRAMCESGKIIPHQQKSKRKKNKKEDRPPSPRGIAEEEESVEDIGYLGAPPKVDIAIRYAALVKPLNRNSPDALDCRPYRILSNKYEAENKTPASHAAPPATLFPFGVRNR